MTFDLTEQERASVGSFPQQEWTIAVFADADIESEAYNCAQRTGARLLGPFALDHKFLAESRSVHLIIIDVIDDGGAPLDRFLDAIDVIARERRLPVIASAPPELIDIVAARLTAPGVTLLMNATLSDRVAAMAAAGVVGVVKLHDVRDETMRLQRLTDEVARIAQALADLAGTDSQPQSEIARSSPAFSDSLIGYRAPPLAAASLPGVTVGARDVRGMIRLRRLRDRYFAQDLFADPAWDILLDLCAARIERTRVAVSSLCIAAAVPPTTALRWIKSMTDEGMLVRVADPTDARRIFIELSERAASAMLNYLGAAKAQDGLAV